MIVAVLTLCCGRALADISDDFETYTAGASIAGDKAGGNSWQGTGGDANTSSTVQNATTDAVMGVSTGAAYSGSNFLRLGDTSTLSTGTSSAHDTFNSTPQNPNGGLSISFALRTDAGKNTDNVVLYGYNSSAGTPSTTLNALEIGIAAGGASTPATFDWYTGGTAGSAGTANKSSALSMPVNVNPGDWYVFNISYKVNATTLVATYSFTVTDASTTTVVLSESMLTGSTLSNTNSNSVAYSYDNISQLVVQTSTSGTGNSDFDAFSIVVAPEPSCIAVFSVTGVGVLSRRRRRRC